jgi:anaerobic magnesium-protoporphyrin IX monomethyl ester cyclase
VQTSRGCPFNCTFCSVTGMFGRRYRHRSTSSIVAELARYDPKRCILFFYDDNFAANPRRTKELLQEMIRLQLGFEWSTQVRVDIARDPELLDLMAQAGCNLLFVGFESVDPEALREMKKNQTVEEIHHAIREIHKRKIRVHGMFVLGFDSDTIATMNAMLRFALVEKIATVQFLILTPFPGSSFYTRMLVEGRLLDAGWDTFDGQHVNFIPRRLTPWELQRAQIVAHARFYSLWNAMVRLLRGSLIVFIICLHAGALNRRWQRQERDYLRRLRLGCPEHFTPI